MAAYILTKPSSMAIAYAGPRMLMAYGGQGDYAVLDFNRSPLDLSAFPIGGRYAGKGH